MAKSLNNHIENLETFLDDAGNFELADDSTVDASEAIEAFTAMKAEIDRLTAECAQKRNDAVRAETSRNVDRLNATINEPHR